MMYFIISILKVKEHTFVMNKNITNGSLVSYSERGPILGTGTNRRKIRHGLFTQLKSSESVGCSLELSLEVQELIPGCCEGYPLLIVHSWVPLQKFPSAKKSCLTQVCNPLPWEVSIHWLVSGEIQRPWHLCRGIQKDNPSAELQTGCLCDNCVVV